MVKTVMTMDCPDCGAIVEIPFRLRPAGTDRPTDPLDGMTDAEAAADDATWD
jgi:hypothetical protein